MDSCWYKRLQEITAIKKQNLLSIAIGFAFFLLLYLIHLVYDGSLCLFKLTFKTPCVGCGMTQGVFCILHMDFHGAVRHNILSIPLFFGIIFYCSLCFFDVLFNRDCICILESRISEKYMYPLYFTIITISYIINFHNR